MRGVVTGLDHIGVAVRDPRQRLPFWVDLLGMELERTEDVPSEGVRTWFIDLGEGTHIELLEPTGETSPIAKHIEKRGEGIAHIALRVDDLDAVVARLASRGVSPLPPGVRPGAGGAKVAFLHPKDAGGVLVELSEHPALHDASWLRARDAAERDAYPGGGADDEDEEHAAAMDDDEPPFGPGTVAVLYLRDPRERLFGVVRQLDEVGCALEGIDLDTWEPWVSQWARGEEGPITPSLLFFPLARVEKILADGDTADLPSFTRRFEERTGRPLAEAFGFEIEHGELGLYEDDDDDDQDEDDDRGGNGHGRRGPGGGAR